jgi:hypothetical protein
MKDYKPKLRNFSYTLGCSGDWSLTYTGLFGGLEHLKIETRFIKIFIMNRENEN